MALTSGGARPPAAPGSPTAPQGRASRRLESRSVEVARALPCLGLTRWALAPRGFRPSESSGLVSRPSTSGLGDSPRERGALASRRG